MLHGLAALDGDPPGFGHRLLVSNHPRPMWRRNVLAAAGRATSRSW